MRPFLGSISSRVLIPTGILMLLVGVGLYIFVFRSMSDFADNFIRNELIEMRRDVYYICDTKHQIIVLSEKTDDQRYTKIIKARTMEALEDYAGNNQAHFVIRMGEEVVYKGAHAEDVTLAEDYNSEQLKQHGYVARVFFEPWQWEVILYKDKKSFSYLMSTVKRVYGITAFFFVIASGGLFFYLNRVMVSPLENITTALRKGVYPIYRGIMEFEFLSDSIRHMMSKLQKETELRISEEKLRSIIETVPVGIAISTPEGRTVDANTSLLEMLGYEKKEDFLKASVMDHYYNPGDRDRFLSLIERDMLKEFEFRMKRRDGSVFWASMTSVKKTEVSEVQYINTFLDISFRKQAEEELINSHKQLINLSRHLESVREEERRKIAREVHDELGQELTVLNMYISWLADRLPDGRDDLLGKIGEMSRLVNRTIRVVQRIVSQLRPAVLDTLGLKAAIENDIGLFSRNSDIKIETRLNMNDKSLDPELAMTIYRIWQEAMTNIVRHSEATKAEVSLHGADGNFVLEIRDNGSGISDEKVYDQSSFGIMGMRERTFMLKGSFIIDSVPGQGTIVRVEIPSEP